MKEKVLKILTTLRPDVDFENETALVTDEILDSFDLVSLVAELNSKFDVTIGADDLEEENFNTVDAMVELINTLGTAILIFLHYETNSIFISYNISS